MNYKQTLDYLYDSLPMFHRIGAAAYKANLNNTHSLCKLLNHPENAFPSIHIAGTNGKGSTSHMLASVMQAAGYKTGLYTSPHLKDFRERIRINGEMIPKIKVSKFVTQHKPGFEKIQPSFFEWTVALAFDYFRNEKVDIAIIETGLGGRLDSTNVITPLLSVITNISLDHTQLLGKTLKKIAKEKAGIIKKDKWVIIGESHPETENVFIQKAQKAGSTLFFADKELIVKKHQEVKAHPELMQMDLKFKSKRMVFPFNKQNDLLNLKVDLTGDYQIMNTRTVLMSLTLLHQYLPISENHVRAGLITVKKSTGLMGRWQILSRKPLIIADTAHNEAGIKIVLKQLRNTSYNQLHFVLGVVNDKAIDAILNLMPKKASYYFCNAKIPRALNANELAQKAAQYKLKGSVYSSVKNAFDTAVKQAKSNDIVLVCGSNFTVAEVI